MQLVDKMVLHCHIMMDSSDRAELLTLVRESIADGYDVNDSGNKKKTPLHLAASYSLKEVAHELIKAGADINSQNSELGDTPLHYAVKVKEIELVCMLLSYGADVTLPNRRNMTPFMFALVINAGPEIADILYDYYDDFSYENMEGYNALLLAAKRRNPLAVTLLKAGADVNCCTSSNLNILSLSLWYDNAELFKLAWPKFDYQILMNSPEFDYKILINRSMPFLLNYLINCLFPATQWLECLYLILESDQAFDIVWNYQESDDCTVKCSLLHTLLLAFYSKEIEASDRLKIIYICLSFGVEANFDDVVCAYELYGFGDELMAFIYIGSHQAKWDRYSSSDLLLPTIILGLEQDYSKETVFESLKELILYGYDFPGPTENRVLNTLAFFSLPCGLKKDVCMVFKDTFKSQSNIFNSSQAIPEIPSLVELCRNQTRSLIKRSNCIEKPYQFYDVLRDLKWPQSIKDIVCFKQPIYR